MYEVASVFKTDFCGLVGPDDSSDLVDWRYAAIELKMLGVSLDEAYLQQRETAEHHQQLKRQVAKEEALATEEIRLQIEMTEISHSEFHDVPI